MFTDISWTAYLILVGIATLIWYCTLAIMQYYSTIKDFLTEKRQHSFSPFYDGREADATTTDTTDHVTPKGVFDEPASANYEVIEELIERVKGLLSESLEKQTPKEGLFLLLEKLLKQYPTLLQSHFKPSVSEFIAGECELQGIADISIEEVEALWRV